MNERSRYSQISTTSTLMTDFDDDAYAEAYPQIHDKDIWRETDLEVNDNGHIILYKYEPFRALLWNSNVNVEAIADSVRLQNICTSLRNAYLGDANNEVISKKYAAMTVGSYILGQCNRFAGEEIEIDGFKMVISNDFNSRNTKERFIIVNTFAKLYASYCMERRFIISPGTMTNSNYTYGDFVAPWEVYMLKAHSILIADDSMRVTPPIITKPVVATKWDPVLREPFIDPESNNIVWYDNQGRRMEKISNTLWKASPINLDFAINDASMPTVPPSFVPHNLLDEEETPREPFGTPIAPPPPPANGNLTAALIIGHLALSSTAIAYYVYSNKPK